MFLRTATQAMQPPPDSAEGMSIRMPVAAFIMLIPNVAADFRRTQVHTKSAQIHKAGEDYGPWVHAIDYIAAIELGEPASDI